MAHRRRVAKRLGVVDTFLVGRPDHPACQGRSFHFRRLAGLPLVLPSTPNGLRSTLDHIAREQRISLNIMMEVDTNTAMKDVAASGHALTILPLLAVQDECREGRLAAVRISRPFVKRTIALSFTKQRPLSKAARLVGSRLRTFTTKLLSASLRPQPACLFVFRSQFSLRQRLHRAHLVDQFRRLGFGQVEQIIRTVHLLAECF